MEPSCSPYRESALALQLILGNADTAFWCYLGWQHRPPGFHQGTAPTSWSLRGNLLIVRAGHDRKPSDRWAVRAGCRSWYSRGRSPGA